MFPDYTDEVSIGKCECYKKLHLLGVPLYISEETEEYAEHPAVISYEEAFQLPSVITINESVTEYPVIEESELPTVFLLMAEVIPCLSDFEINPVTFWIMDIFIEGLWTAQANYFSQFHQKATLLWIAYFFNYLQKKNPTRKELFRHMKAVIFTPENLEGSDMSSDEMAGESVKSNEKEEAAKKVDLADKESVWELVLPPDYEGEKEETAAVTKISSDTNTAATEEGERTASEHSSDIQINETISERNVTHMKIIIEILYRIFGRLWVFGVIRTTFHNMPPVENVELPFTLKTPKPTQKPESATLLKTEKGAKKIQVPEKSPEEIEAERELHKHDYILPLQASEEAKLYAKELFSSPASAQSILVKGKGKK